VSRKPKPISRPRRRRGRRAYRFLDGRIERWKTHPDGRMKKESAVLYQQENEMPPGTEIETESVSELPVREVGLDLQLGDVEAGSRDQQVLSTLIATYLVHLEVEAIVEKALRLSASETEVAAETGIEIETRTEILDVLVMRKRLVVGVAHGAEAVGGIGTGIEQRGGAGVAVRMRDGTEILGETAAGAVTEIGRGDVREAEVETGIERGREVEVEVVDGSPEGTE